MTVTTKNMKKSKSVAVVAKPVALKALNVPLAPSGAKEGTKTTVAQLLVEGDAIREYNLACAAEKLASDAKAVLRPVLAVFAVDNILALNVKTPTSPVTTINLIDKKGNNVNVSFKNAYEAVDGPSAVLTLAGLGVKDPNVFMQEKVQIKFDSSVFFEANGDLKEALYTDVLEALTRIAAEHSVASPFSSDKVTTVRPTFHAQRWTIGKGVSDQQVLTLQFRNTISLTPQPKIVAA